MLGPPKVCCLDQPVTVSLDALVPRDNFYRHLDAKLDLSFVRAWVADCYTERGRPRSDRIGFCKLQRRLFCEAIQSARQRREPGALNRAHRYSRREGLDAPRPDLSRLTRRRVRRGLPVCQRLFEPSVALAPPAGRGGGKQRSCAATKLGATAAVASRGPRCSAAAPAHLGDRGARAAAAGTAVALGRAADPPAELTAALRAVAPPQRATATGAAAPGPRPWPATPKAHPYRAAPKQAAWHRLEAQRRDPGPGTRDPGRPARGRA